MSAFVGIIAPEFTQELRHKALVDMATEIHGRGREPFASWLAPEASLAIGIRPLTTLDLTPDGRRPAINSEHRIVVALDGYIANAPELRRELEEKNIRLQGHGDAELLAHAAALFGLNRLLQKLEGAFAFALWDGQKQTLHLVRDRMGAKPLYITQIGKIFAFASSPDAFQSLRGYKFEIDPRSAAQYLSLGFVASPNTLQKYISCIPAGHRLMLKPDLNTIPDPETWWSPVAALEEIALRKISGNDNPNRLSDVYEALVSESTHIDIPFALLDTGAPDTRIIRQNLERKSEKPFTILPLATPDGAALQAAFDTLAAAALPFSNPDALRIYPAIDHIDDDTGIVLAACNAAFFKGSDKHQKMRFLPRPVRRMVKGALPKSMANWGLDGEDIYLARETLWPDVKTPEMILNPPRIDIAPDDLADYFDFCGKSVNGYMPMLDMLGGLHNKDMRVPLASETLFEFAMPAVTVSTADISAWLRGPLRIRMQNALTPRIYDALSLKNPDPYAKAWQKFLNGDTTQAPRLWAYLTLAAWTDRKIS